MYDMIMFNNTSIHIIKQEPQNILIHGSCLYFNNKTLLITGAPKTGKTSALLSLINQGALMISDDVTLLKKDNKIFCTAPKALKGILHIRDSGFEKKNIHNGGFLDAIFHIEQEKKEHNFIEIWEHIIPVFYCKNANIVVECINHYSSESGLA